MERARSKRFARTDCQILVNKTRSWDSWLVLYVPVLYWVRFEHPSHYLSLKALIEQRKPGLSYLNLLVSGDLAALLSGDSSFSLQKLPWEWDLGMTENHRSIQGTMRVVLIKSGKRYLPVQHYKAWFEVNLWPEASWLLSVLLWGIRQKCHLQST